MEQSRAKAPFGQACNRCGYCCEMSLCKMGVALFGDMDGPCPGLEEAPDGKPGCGPMMTPQLYAPVRTARFGVAGMQEAARFLIGAGDVCDAETEEEHISKQLRASLHEAGAQGCNQDWD